MMGKDDEAYNAGWRAFYAGADWRDATPPLIPWLEGYVAAQHRQEGTMSIAGIGDHSPGCSPAEHLANQAHQSGHGEACWYCRLPCSAIAGDPGKWPLLLPLDETRPGECVAVCTRCVLDRLKAREVKPPLLKAREIAADFVTSCYGDPPEPVIDRLTQQLLAYRQSSEMATELYAARRVIKILGEWRAAMEQRALTPVAGTPESLEDIIRCLSDLLGLALRDYAKTPRFDE